MNDLVKELSAHFHVQKNPSENYSMVGSHTEENSLGISVLVNAFCVEDTLDGLKIYRPVAGSAPEENWSFSSSKQLVKFLQAQYKK